MTEMEPNAFTINRLNGGFFPLSLKVTRADGVTNAFMCAQRVADCADLIAEHSTGRIAMFGLEQYSVFDEAGEFPLSLAALARQAGLPFTTIDEETIVLPAGQLTPLLAGFSPDDLTMFDLPSTWNVDAVIRGVLAYREHDWSGEELLLPELPGSRFFIASHDDCYLTVESSDSILPRQIFARMLGLYASTVIEQADIAAVPERLVNANWQDNFGLTILRDLTEVTPSGLHIGVACKPFNFRDDESYPVDFYLMYDVNGQKWERDE